MKDPDNGKGLEPGAPAPQPQSATHSSREASGAEPAVSTFQTSLTWLFEGGVMAGATRPGLVGRIGRFEVVRPIGSGGMGIVVLARDSDSGSLVAIKILRPELAGSATTVQRFLSEARHMQRLRHPNILPVLESAESNGIPYFVMPFVERGSLAETLKAGQPLPCPQALRIARQVAEALAHAHARGGIIHRDLKPANVLLGADGTAFLTDFGLARTVFNDSFVDPEGSHREGTPPYMSPAVAAGEAEDTRCDIYGLGALLYEMLTGRPPYRGTSSKEILEAIAARPPNPIRQANPRADARLTSVAEGAMARELRERYAQITDVARDLDRVEAGQAPLGPRDSSGSARRWSARRITALWVTGVAGLMMGVAFMVWRGDDPGGPVITERLKLVRPIEAQGVQGILDWASARVGQWQPRSDPVVFLPVGNRLIALSTLGRRILDSAPLDPRQEDMRLWLLRDLLGDPSADAVVSWSSGRYVCLSVLNQNLQEVRRFTTEGRWKTNLVGDTSLSTIETDWVGDLENDGTREILAQVATSWTNSLPIRGLYCFDFETAELRWHHLTGPSLHEATPVDLDGDGIQEIIIGSYAAANGHSADDGTDDFHSYLYAFEADGRLRWRLLLGGALTGIHPLTTGADGTERLEVFAWLDGPHELWLAGGQPEIAPVFRIDRHGKVLDAVDLGARLHSCQAADLDGDGREELLATDRLGTLHVLNAQLQILGRTNFVANPYDYVVLRLALVADLDSDGSPELLLTACQVERVANLGTGTPDEPRQMCRWYDRQLLVLDHRLRIIGHLRFPDILEVEPITHLEVVDVDGDGRKEIFWLGPEALILKLIR